VVQIWSRSTPESGVNETLVLHRVEGPMGFAVRFGFGVSNLRCGVLGLGIGTEAGLRVDGSGVGFEAWV